MKDDEIQRLIRTLDVDDTPPAGLQETILARIKAGMRRDTPVLSPVERFFCEKPLRAASALALAVSGVLWAAAGGNWIGWLNRFMK